MRRRKPLLWSFVALTIACGLAFTIRYWALETRVRNEQEAARAIKLLTVAEVEFRSNDRDENKINDFWTGDVTGLYSINPQPPGVRPAPIHLIPRELAEADAAPIHPLVPAPRPYHGYFFRSMLTDETGVPYGHESGSSFDKRGVVYNTSKFAFCAYPANPTSEMHVFIVNEGNTIFKWGRLRPILNFPTDEELMRMFPPQAPRRTSDESTPGLTERWRKWWSRTDLWLICFAAAGVVSLCGISLIWILSRR